MGAITVANDYPLAAGSGYTKNTSAIVSGFFGITKYGVHLEYKVVPATGSYAATGTLECPRFGGHLSAWSAVSDWVGRIVRHAKGIELQEAVPAGVPA